MSHSKLKVLVHSNYSRMVTGFGKNMKNILLALYNDPDIEVIEAANGVSYGYDMKTPWQSYGTLPSDQNTIQEIGGDQYKHRLASYGHYCIDKIIEDCKPDIYLGIEDIWAFQNFDKKPWWNQIKKVIWTTLDSVPILDEAIQMAPKCDKFLVWASFAEKAMKDLGVTDVQTVHGAVDYSNFKPLNNKKELKQKFNLSDNFVIGFVFKNQLRKSVPNLLDGFRLFKEENPNSNAKLLLHTDWSEVGHGWDIPRYLKEKNINNNDVLATYVCYQCDNYFINNYQGEEKDCPCCGSKKTVKTKNSGKGVREYQLNEIYNIMDVYCHPFTSGGQELPIQEAKSAGLITLVTEYSCGTDSCYKYQGGIPLKWNEYREPQTQFIKATTCPNSICEKLTEVFLMSEDNKKILISNGMKYVQEKFSVQNTVRILKDIFTKLEKNNIQDTQETQKEKIKQIDFSDLLDKNDKGKRLAIVIPESAGDVLLVNALISNIKETYPEYNIYIITKPQYFNMVDDHPDVHKLIPFQNGIDNLHFLEGKSDHEGYFEIAFLPHIGTQRYLNYHHNAKDKIQFNLK